MHTPSFACKLIELASQLTSIWQHIVPGSILQNRAAQIGSACPLLLTKILLKRAFSFGGKVTLGIVEQYFLRFSTCEMSVGLGSESRLPDRVLPPPYSALLGSVALFGHPSTPHVVIEKPLLSQNGRSSCCFSSGSSCKLTAPLLWVALLLLCLQRAHRLDRRGKSTLNHLLRSRQLGSRNLQLVSFFPRSRAFTRTQCALIVMIKWEMGNGKCPTSQNDFSNS